MQATFARSISVPGQRLKVLSEKSDLRGGLQTGSHLLALGVNTWLLSAALGSVAAAAESGALVLLLVAALFASQGILINCLYAGVHELSHNTVFKTRRLNVFFGRLFTFVLLMGRDQDKFEHFQHHRYTQDIERDAEIAGAKPFTLRSYLLYFFGLSYWPYRVGEVLKLAAGATAQWPHLSPAQFRVVHREARLMLVGYALIAVLAIRFGSAAPLTLWLLPMLCMKWFQMLQNTVEHTGMPHEDDIVRNTRTVRANAVMRWLLWNMPYHTAHHSYPIVPFFRLPELHAEVVASLGKEPPTVTHWEFQKYMLRKLRQENSSRFSGLDISAY